MIWAESGHRMIASTSKGLAVLELVAPMEIDVLPGDGGDFLDRLRALRIAAFSGVQKAGKE